MPNFVTQWQEVFEISTVKNVCSRKSGLKFTKIGDDQLHTNASYMRNFMVLGQTMYEKSVTKLFSHPSVFRHRSGTPQCQSSPIWVMTYSKTPSIKLPNFVRSWKPVYEISAAKVHLFHGRQDRHIEKKSSASVKDWCKSLHDIAGPRARSSRNRK